MRYSSTPLTQLRDRIKAARILAGMSQPELAAKLGVGEQTVKRREYGTAPVSTEALMALAQATGVPLAWIVEGFSDEQVNQPLDVTLQRVRLPDPPAGIGDE